MENNKEYKSIKDELKDMAPGLADIPKKDSFTVPENFFEKFPVMVSDKIHAQKNKSWWSELANVILKPAYALPVVAIIAFGTYTYLNNQTIITPAEILSVTVEDLSKDEILSQLDENIITDEIASITPEENLTTETTDIENYLIDNNTDINTLANEL